MKFNKITFIVVGTVLGVIQCGFVDNLKKCKYEDKDCQKDILQTALKTFAKGARELDIDAIDPLKVKNMDIINDNLMELKIFEGTVIGASDCIINKLDSNLETSRLLIDVTCDLQIKGKYYIHSSADFIQNILGGVAHGNGTGEIKIEKCNLKIEFPISLEKRGVDLFVILDSEKRKDSFDILGEVIIAADNLYVGETEKTTEMVNLLNQNWKLLVASFGNKVFDVAMDVVSTFMGKFFHSVPVSKYIEEDLTSYLN